MIGHIIMMSLAGSVLATEILFDSPTPTEPNQVTRFFTIQYITSTVALSPQTVTETINPTCTITASSIPVCGEASVGIIFTSGGMLPVRQDVTTTESDPITTSTPIMPDDEATRTDDEETTTPFWSLKDQITTSTTKMPSAEEQRTDDDETTTSWTLKVDEADMKDKETTTSWSVKLNENDMKDEETTTFGFVKVDEEEDGESTTTTAPHSRLDLTENEIEEFEYNDVETTTFINYNEEDISNDISDDRDSSNTDLDMNIKNDEQMSSVTKIENTDDTEIMSIINEINLSPQTSTVPLKDMQKTITDATFQTDTNTGTIVEESETASISMASSVHQDLPLSTSYEMATVVMPSCDCASNRQPRNEDMANIITFMTTKTVKTPTVTMTGTAMHTIQYAGCLPEDAVVTTSCG